MENGLFFNDAAMRPGYWLHAKITHHRREPEGPGEWRSMRLTSNGALELDSELSRFYVEKREKRYCYQRQKTAAGDTEREEEREK